MANLPNRPLLRRTLCVLLLAAFLPAAPKAHAQETGETLNKEGTFREDLYLAGGRVRVAGVVEGDIVVAGGNVSVPAAVSQDVIAAGGEILLEGEYGDDLRVAGGEVTLGGPVEGDAVLAGGTIRLGEATRVAGRTWLAGGRIEVDGVLSGELRIMGDQVTIAGSVTGPADIYANRLTILSSARMEGPILYHGPEPAVVEDGARLTQGISYEQIERQDVDGRWAGLFFLFAWLVLGLAWVFLFPAFSRTAAEATLRDPFPAAGTAVLIAIVTPLIAFLLFLSVVGFLAALVLLGLWLLWGVFGYVNGLVVLGTQVLRWVRRGGAEPVDPARANAPGMRAATVAVGVLVLAILTLIPGLGPGLSFLLSLLLWLLGAGGLARALLARYREAKPAPRSA